MSEIQQISDIIGLTEFTKKFKVDPYLIKITNQKTKSVEFSKYCYYSGNKSLPIIIFKEDNEFKITSLNKFKKHNILMNSIKDSNYFELFDELIDYKIINYEESGNLFKYKLIKKEMFENQNDVKYGISEIKLDHNCKLDNTIRPIISLFNPTKAINLKFVLSDIGFNFPNNDIKIKIDNMIKGYNEPKNKNIKAGIHFKVINNKNIRNVDIGQKGIVKELTNVRAKGHSNYIKAVINDKEIILTKRNIKIIT